MTSLFHAGKKILIGVIHLSSLPGSPRWRGSLDKVIRMAVTDARAYQSGGADAVIVENFGDMPFTKSNVAPETIAAMAVAGRAVRESIHLPIGFNVLRNDPCAGLALCVACGGSFIRVNVHSGAMLTDQGIVEGNAYETLRYRAKLRARAEIFADVHVKHAVVLGDQRIEHAARDTVERGLADALIVTGAGTGIATNLSNVKAVRAGCPTARILIGSGVSQANVSSFLPFADGVIVGSSLKKGGRVDHPVDVRRVAALVRQMRQSSPVGRATKKRGKFK